MATMLAAFFEGPRTITVREAPVPEPAPGEVRLAVRACGICGSDLSLYKSGALAGPDVILGHEIAAEVDLDPSGALAPGTRVVPFPTRGCGDCLWCREGRPRYCLNPPHGAGGGFAQYVCYPAACLIPIPSGMADRAAALAEPLGVGVRAVEMAGLAPGDLAYVSGLGSIGLLTTAALRAAGCRVVGADPRDDRRRIGMDLGCVAVLDPALDDAVGGARSFDPHGPRAAFECSGAPDALQQAFDVCGPGGTVAVLGIPMAPVLLLRMTLKEQRAFSISGPSDGSMRRGLELLASADLAAPLVTVVPLERTNESFAALADGDGGVKVLVSPFAKNASEA